MAPNCSWNQDRGEAGAAVLALCRGLSSQRLIFLRFLEPAYDKVLNFTLSDPGKGASRAGHGDLVSDAVPGRSPCAGCQMILALI